MSSVFQRISVGPLQVNCYILGAGSEVVIVDPGADSERLFELIDGQGWEPQAVLLTHGHIDHIAHVRSVTERYDVGLYVHGEDRPFLESAQMRDLALLLQAQACPEPERVLEHGDKLEIAGLELEVIHTPGHSPGGVCYLDGAGSRALVGDTIFQRGIGRTDLPGGSYDTLGQSIRERLFTLPEDTVLWPGHGPETTVGEERVGNPFFGERG